MIYLATFFLDCYYEVLSADLLFASVFFSLDFLELSADVFSSFCGEAEELRDLSA
jgi:hypothetical protein